MGHARSILNTLCLVQYKNTHLLEEAAEVSAERRESLKLRITCLQLAIFPGGSAPWTLFSAFHNWRFTDTVLSILCFISTVLRANQKCVYVEIANYLA
jgi:hypothetical protein